MTLGAWEPEHSHEDLPLPTTEVGRRSAFLSSAHPIRRRLSSIEPPPFRSIGACGALELRSFGALELLELEHSHKGHSPPTTEVGRRLAFSLLRPPHPSSPVVHRAATRPAHAANLYKTPPRSRAIRWARTTHPPRPQKPPHPPPSHSCTHAHTPLPYPRACRAP